MCRFLSVVAFVVLLFALPAWAQDLLDAPVSFSATRSVTINGMVYTGPMFHVPGHERHEQNLFGVQEVFLLDCRQKAGALILPAQKTIVDFVFPPLLTSLLDAPLDGSGLGEEKIDEVSATKYRVEKTATDGTRGEGFLWVSRRGVLVKLSGTMTAPGGHRTTIEMVLQDLKEAPQAPDLFTPPTGLSRLPMEAIAPLLGFKALN